MFGGIIDAILPFLNAPVQMWAFLIDLIFGFATKITDWITVFLTQTFVNLVAEIVPQFFVDFVNQPVVMTILGLTTDVFWFYPVIPVLVIYANAYTIAGLIRVVRYVIGYIPTVEG